MDQDDVRTYVESYFRAMNCHILASTDEHMEVQLSEAADKDLINRPFYWTYVEKMGLNPQYVTLSLIFDEDAVSTNITGEYISFGSPRLQHIFQSARKHGRFVRLYEDVTVNEKPRGSRPFIPWFVVNYKISWICDQLRNEILSLGIQLLDGSIEEDCYTNLAARRWTPRLPSFRFIVKPKLSLAQALNELEFYLQGYIEQLDHSWARRAERRMHEELERLEQYYRDSRRTEHSEELDNEYRRRMTETKRQYQPRIDVAVINAGLFFMT